jgi:hypothetical protein
MRGFSPRKRERVEMPNPLTDIEIAAGLALARERWAGKTYKHNTPWTGINEKARARNLDGANKLLEGFDRYRKFTPAQREWARKLLSNAAVRRKEIEAYMVAQLPKGAQAQETGHLTMLERVKAFRHLVWEVSEFADPDELTEASYKFISEQWDKLGGLSDEELAEVTVSAKQYFWAKDLYDRYCL